MTVNILSMKWGTRYDAGYVNRLFAGVRRNLRQPFRFLCFTDDASGIHSAVETLAIPDLGLPDRAFRRGAWPKVGILRDGLANLEGPCLFLDLDLLILRPLDEFFSYRSGEYCLIKDWEQPYQRLRHRGKPRIGNTSVFRFDAGTMGYVVDALLADREGALASFRNEQRFVSHHARSRCWWPDEWVASFKRHCIPFFPLNLVSTPREPQAARAVAFHGRPNPHEALAGYRTGPVHRWVRPTTWIARYWESPEPEAGSGPVVAKGEGPGEPIHDG